MIGWLIGALILFLCFGTGHRALSFFKIALKNDEKLVFGTALGLGILAYAVLLLGLLHILYVPVLWALLGAMLISAALNFREILKSLQEGFCEWKVPLALPYLPLGLLALIPVLSALLGTLAPEIANDSLCYHLHLPKLYLGLHWIGKVPYEVNALFPSLMEMLYTLGLGVGGVTLAKFFHFATGLLSAGGILMFLRRYVSMPIAWLAALLFLATPGIVNQLDSTYIDAAFTCFSFLALIPALRWMETRSTGWVLLAGIFAGFALSVKYLALIPILILYFFIAYRAARNRFDVKKTGTVLLTFLGTAFVCSAYWYLRAWIEWGNPVYPYFYQVFKSGDPAMTYDDIGVRKTLFNFLLIPWTITMHPEKFEGFGVQFGPAFLAFLPLAAVEFRKIPFGRQFAGYGFFYLLAWFVLAQDLRFLYPILPVLCVLMAFGFARMKWGKAQGKAVAALVAAVFLMNALLAIYHFRNIYPVAFGRQSTESYLGKMERSYRISQQLNRGLAANAKILSNESHLFYYEMPIVRESIYARCTEYFIGAKNPEDVFRRVTAEGFTHILSLEGPMMAAPDSIEPFRVPSILGLAEEKGLIKKVYSFQPNEFKGEPVMYVLYSIQEQTR